MSLVVKDILEFWDEKAFNPSSRHQRPVIPNLEKIISEKVEKEIFSKFPELVAEDIKVDISDDVQLNMVNIFISWRVWMPTGVQGKIVTLQKAKSVIKLQFFADMLEKNPHAFESNFEQALDLIEDQMDKVKFEFYKRGIDPQVVASYVKKYSGGSIIQMLYNFPPISQIGVIP